MDDAPTVYRKLPGRSGGVIASSTLWEGADHLLLVCSWPSGESYRRFFFSDIQAIIVRRTPRRLIINIVFLVLVAITSGVLLLVGVGTGGIDTAGLVVAAAFSTGWFVCILVNSAFGPTCETQIQTIIQTERIPSLGRLQTALRVLARIQPAILAAQPAAAPSDSQPVA